MRAWKLKEQGVHQERGRWSTVQNAIKTDSTQSRKKHWQIILKTKGLKRFKDLVNDEEVDVVKKLFFLKVQERKGRMITCGDFRIQERFFWWSFFGCWFKKILGDLTVFIARGGRLQRIIAMRLGLEELRENGIRAQMEGLALASLLCRLMGRRGVKTGFLR